MTDSAERTASWQPGRKPEPGEMWQRVPQAGETLASRFRPIRILGAGGSGVVFEAEDLALRQRVAVKVIHAHLAEPRALERLRRRLLVLPVGDENLTFVPPATDASSGAYHLFDCSVNEPRWDATWDLRARPRWQVYLASGGWRGTIWHGRCYTFSRERRA